MSVCRAARSLCSILVRADFLSWSPESDIGGRIEHRELQLGWHGWCASSSLMLAWNNRVAAECCPASLYGESRDMIPNHTTLASSLEVGTLSCATLCTAIIVHETA